MVERKRELKALVKRGKVKLPEKDETPKDELTYNESETKFAGKGCFYILDGEDLVLRPVRLDVGRGKALSPFRYKKPMVDLDVFFPEEDWEDKDRKGYYPLAIVHKAFRGPNHWHREDSAILCAVQVDGEWQTRYFPRQNVSEETWQEAVRLLGSTEQ